MTGNERAAIETHELSRSFGQRVVVDRLSVRIAAGSVFGFLGPNGAGKTTTVRMLAALIAPTAGDAVVAGHRLGRDDDALRGSVGILTETPGLYDRLTPIQNLTYFARLYDLTPDRAAEQVRRYLELLDLWDRRDDAVGTFSKGMRQRLAVARALLHEPPVLFLDEPTAGLDPEAKREIREFIKALRSEGRTIFLTTHDLAEADELCDLIAVFRTRLIRVDSPGRLRAAFRGSGTLVATAGDPRRWVDVARGLPFVRGVDVENGELAVRLDEPDAQNPLLIRALVEAGADLRYVRPITATLEDVYLQIVREEK